MGFDGFEALSLKKRKRDQEARARRKAEKQRLLQDHLLDLAHKQPTSEKMRLNCSGCGAERTIVGIDIGRFSIVAQVCGVILSLVSIFGLGAALMIFFLDTAKLVHSLVALAISIGSGAIGWILLLRKRLFVCESCGLVYD